MAQSLNRTLFHADNLPVLRGIDTGTVDLIATDPPFNKSRDFHATPDSLASGARFADRWSWERDVHEEWVDQLYDDWRGVYEVVDAARHAAGDDMAAFICWLGVRVIEMHRVLKPTGSLYLHIDHTAHAWTKAMLDAIFGRQNFQNEITWKRTGSHGGAKRWGPIHDTLLFYTRGNNYTWNRVFQEYEKSYIDDYYRHEDDRGRFRLVTLTGAGTTRHGDSGKPWRGIDPSDVGRHWAVPIKAFRSHFPNIDPAAISTQAKLDLLDEAGIIYWPERGTIPQQKRYLDEGEGVPIQDTITDISPISSQAAERLGYPTQKPLTLYERIIKASSNEDDLVLDPFCGCATTCVAAERLGRQWIGIDIWEGAHNLVLKRLRDEQRMFAAEHVTYTNKPPQRTDEGEVAAPFLKLKLKRALEPWQRISRKEIVERLIGVQSTGDFVVCAGCGRGLESPFMELDHIMPRADGGDNWITNRILLCRPCNGKKGANLTLTGLVNQNKKDGWMSDAARAEIVTSKARDYADGVAAGG